MDEPVTVTLQVPAPLFWGALTLAGVLAASWLIYLTLPEAKGDKGPLHKLTASLGLGRIHPVLMLTSLTLYMALVGILLLGLFGLILSTLEASGRTNDYLFYVLRIGGLTAVLGAVIALPFTLVRLKLSQQQTETAQESLFNDKINEATKGLYARRQITTWHRKQGYVDHWQDDIVQRNAAIDRLEGLAKEKPTEIPRIARLLSVYVRELSAEVPPHEPPNDATPDELRDWAQALPKLRSDMEKAVQTLGSLANVAPDPLENGEIDLRGANLQSADLKGVKFDKALLQGAQVQGAFLDRAQLQGADLHGARFDDTTDLSAVTLRGAALSAVDCTNVPQMQTHLDDIYGDASVGLPKGVTAPDHWYAPNRDEPDFVEAWREWQATLPSGWDAPDY